MLYPRNSYNFFLMLPIMFFLPHTIWRGGGKTVADVECHLCGGKIITLNHLLNLCPTALHQGRFTWRYDNIFRCMAKYVNLLLKVVNAGKIQNLTIKDKFINFVKEGGKSKGWAPRPAAGVLHSANDWELKYDDALELLMLPIHIAQTSLRPDMVLFSNLTKQVILLGTYSSYGR